VNAEIDAAKLIYPGEENHMKPTNQNMPSNHSAQYSSASNLAVAAACFFGLALSGLSRYSVAQAPTASSTAMSISAAKQAGWVQIPGELIRPDCVHAVPSGAKVEVGTDGQITGDVSLNGAVIAHYDACSEDAIVTRPRARTEGLAKDQATGNGWVEADQWNVPLSQNDDIDYLAGTWTVPSYPSESGAVLYPSNGVESASSKWILQPVLQYGLGFAGGGNYWTISSWLVSANEVFYSPLVQVYPGNSISGYTQMTGISGNTKYFEVLAQDNTTGNYSYLNAYVSGQHWTWAYAGILEAYELSSCAQFPANGREVFKGTVVDHGFPAYKSATPHDFYGAIYGYGGPTCHFAVVAASGTLDF
jgi:hypothetical protein